MVKRKGGIRRKTRSLMRKNFRLKGKVSLTRFFQKFNIGEVVVLKAEPAYHNGMYHLRYHGKSGIIIKPRGDCYVVEIKDGKRKILIVHPVHLNKVR